MRSSFRESGYGVSGKEKSIGADRTPLKAFAMRPTTTAVKSLNKMRTLPIKHDNISVTHQQSNPSRMGSVDSARAYGNNVGKND